MNKNLVRALAAGLLAIVFFIITFSPLILQVSPSGVQSVAAQSLPEISFDQASYSVNESDLFIVVNVNIITPTTPITPLTAPMTVTYFTVNSSASAGSDYTGVNNGQLVFPGFKLISSMSKPITITINDDTISEPAETFNIVLENTPQNAVLGTQRTTTIQINASDGTATPTSTSGATIFADHNEPNDTTGDATDISPNGGEECNLTLWPIGDSDYFRFNGKKDLTYEVKTSELTSGVDTFIRVFDTNLNVIATNDDDGTIGSRASQITFVADKDGFYFVEITNVDPGDPTGKTYCFEVNEITPQTPTPSNTPVPGEDTCEFNSTFETACLVGVNEEVSLSFVPSLGSEQDTDILKMWILPGVFYTCETFDLAAVTDTNIILYNQDQQPFNPWIGNADRAPGDPSSEVEYLSTYKGWLYVMIGPENIPTYEESPLHTYSARCTAITATSTPTPTATFVSSGPVSGVSTNTPEPTATPFEIPTPVPTPTPFDLSILTPIPPTRPVIDIQTLPTSTPVAGSSQALTVNVTLFYDENDNFSAELTEGIMDAAVALYDNTTSQLIAFGYTNEAGMVQFSNIETAGAVRVDVPFLNYSQVVLATNSEILIRVASHPLPIGIP